MQDTIEPNASRRGFLTKSTLMVGGAVAVPNLLSSRAWAAGSDTLKVGLVGCGGRGSGAANQALSADPNLVLTAMADAFDEQIQKSLKNLKVKHGEKVQVEAGKSFTGLDAYQKLIDSGVDVVLLASPPGFRPQHIKAAVAAGKHVFAEKPMATDGPGVRSVMESTKLAKEKNQALVAGFCWRYDLPRREFYKQILGGAIGDVRAVYATYLTSPVKPMPAPETRPAGMGDVEWQLRNWYNFYWLSGDGLVEQACHSVDKINWVMGDKPPIKAVASGGRMIPNNEGNIYDHIDVFYEYENGVRAFMAQRQISNCYSENSDYIMCANGYASIKGGKLAIKGKDVPEFNYAGPKIDMYQQEHNELFASIRAGKPINDGEWMARSTLMALMGRMAAYTGKEVKWEEALNSQEKIVPDNLDWNMKLPIQPISMPGRTKFI
ncbi:MAG: Gfo/Idh/MocA family oxidoreductase [Verrucomicrobiota bacterium]